MKRFYLVLSLSIICLFCCPPFTCFALDFDPRQVQLEYQNAPDGTAYIDVLAKISESDDVYTDFNVAPKRLVDKAVVNGNTKFIYETLNINESSDITKYNEDGFVSLSLHSKEVKGLEILKSYGYESDCLILDCFADDLYAKYRNIKIAYVREDGEILKVIDVSNRDYSNSDPCALIADDNNAKYRSFGTSPLTGLFLFVIIIALIFVTVILPIILIIKKHLDSKRAKQLISNNEQAN